MASGGGGEEGFLCSLCTSKNKSKEAEKYCVDCQDYYCCTCVKFHEDVPALSKHKILDKEQFQPAASQTLPAVPTERCEKHNHNHVDMYCQVHDVVGCPTCMATEHRLCHPIFYIPEFLKNQRKPSTAHAMESLEATIAKSKQYQTDAEGKIKLMMKGKAELLQKIKSVRKSLNDRLDVLEQGSVKKVEEMYGPVLDMVQEELKKLQAIEDSVSSAKNNLAPTNDNVSQDFVNIKKGETLIRYAEKCFTDCRKTRISTADKDYVTDPTLLEKLEKMNMLGYVMPENMTEIEELDNEAALEVRSAQLKNTPTKTSLNDPNQMYQKKCDVKHQTDAETPSIISACVPDDGMIILADLRNKNLKRVDNMTYSLTDYTKVPGTPWKLCVINKNEVAVSCQYSGVQFVSLHPKMMNTKQFQTDHICIGLAYANGHLYISDLKSIYIYTISSTKLQQFFCTTDQLEVKRSFFSILKKPAPFSRITSLSAADNGSKIYVADGDTGLVVLDRNGKVTGKYNGTEMNSTCDVCQSDSNSILVLGSNPRAPRRVLKFGHGCELIGEVLKAEEESSSRQAICFNHFNSKLIVTYSHQNEIEFYDLTKSQNLWQKW